MKIYAVCCGEYSDYNVCELFSKRRLANQYIIEMSEWYNRPKNDYDIVVYNVDKPILELKIVQVHMDKEGNTTYIYHAEEDYIGFCCFDSDRNLVWNVNTDNDEKAVKVVNEKRIQILAKDIWGNHDKVNEMFKGV